MPKENPQLSQTTHKLSQMINSCTTFTSAFEKIHQHTAAYQVTNYNLDLWLQINLL